MAKNTLNLLLFFSYVLIQNTFAANLLPGFSNNSKALCRLHLNAQKPNHGSSLETSFLARRSIAQAQYPGTNGQMNQDLANIFGLESGTNGKSFVMENLWWGESEALVKAHDKTYGKESSKVIPKEGVLVPRYTGEMLFTGDKAQARIIVSVIDAQKAVPASDLTKLPLLKPNAEVVVTINDSGKNITEATFREWIQTLIVDSGMSKDLSNPSSLQITSHSKKDGSTDFTFRMPRRTLPYREITWFVENVQKSLAADDYWETRRDAERRLGIPDRNQMSGDIRTTPFNGAAHPMRISDPSGIPWDEITEATGNPLNGAKSKKENGRKKATPYKRGSKAMGAWESEED